MLRRLALVLATTLLLPCALSNEALALDGETEAEAQDRELFLLNLLKKTDDGRSYDFIIVGSGPAGCLLAKYLTDSGEDTVLLLEAGSDDDNDKTIRDGNNIVSPELFGLKYFWQEPAKFNPRSQGDSQIVGGKSLGGGTSVNGMQWVWPSKGFMQEMSQASGHDPDWSVKSIQDAIREVEAYQGKSENPQARGYEGIIPVTQRPADRQASGAGLRLLEAFKHVTKLPELEDYNNPDTPVGPWLKWQQNRDQHNKRASASVRFLSHEVRARPNLVIKTKCLVNRVTFEGTRAGGVEFKEGIHTKTAKANKEVIVSAGVHSAPILERSGVGNQHIIGKVLKAAKKPFVAHVPGVGEGFGSDGGHLLFFTHNPKDRVDNVDFFRSGAYFPYPGRDPNAPGSPRFTQWFGFGPLKILPLTFQVYVDMYNVSSRGSVHIKSANAIHSAEWDTGLFSNPEDLKNLVRVFREQVLPVADSLRANGGGFYKLVSPPRHLLTNKDDKPLIHWLKTKYIKGYHYFGATAMRPLSKGGVVDSDCKVYGVTGLRVVDVSIMPVKPDSNTQIYSYFAGVIAAKKILREYAKPVISYSEAVDEEEEGDEEGEGIIYEEEEGEEEAGAEEEEEGDEE